MIVGGLHHRNFGSWADDESKLEELSEQKQTADLEKNKQPNGNQIGTYDEKRNQ